MGTMQLRSNVTIEMSDFVGGVSRLDTDEIEQLLTEIGMVLARRKAVSVSNRESELLKKIGSSLPANVQNRYNSLQTKSVNGQLGESEHQEYLGLIKIVENADVERLQHLIELARLRGVTLDKVMAQLGIRTPSAYA